MINFNIKFYKYIILVKIKINFIILFKEKVNLTLIYY